MTANSRTAPVDLRSDTVTRPTAGMRRAMAEAPVGDDVYGEDPSVNELEELVARRTGFERALFVPSGTQSNLVALLAHCQRGDEYLAGELAHCYRYEGGGAAVLGGIQPQPVAQKADGTLDLGAVAAAIKPLDSHFARSRLLCLENTFRGRSLPLDYLRQAGALARERGLALHLDGARLFNAAEAQRVAVTEITHHFDSVSFCLSKGLGAPVGSLLCGGRELIADARRWRKVVGGGMRQAGVLAAAGKYALEHHVQQLAEDHAHAQVLADGLAAIAQIGSRRVAVHTNMVWLELELPGDELASLRAHLRSAGVLISAHSSSVRLVTHLDVDRDGIARAVEAFATYFRAARNRSRGMADAR